MNDSLKYDGKNNPTDAKAEPENKCEFLSLPRLVISAPHRSSGKTTISIGLCRALTDQGMKVQSFKKGPDFIDPMWLSSATRRNCYNLDYFMMGDDKILWSFQKNSLGTDIGLVEGNMGLYDGMEEDGRGSTAELSRLLQAPVILVVDARKMTRSIAPLVNGFQKFEPGTNVAGVMLNRVSGARHESKLRAAIERYCDIEVVGAIPMMPKMEILERHLGLKPADEEDRATSLIGNIGDSIKDYVDLRKIIDIARAAPSMKAVLLSDINDPGKVTTYSTKYSIIIPEVPEMELADSVDKTRSVKIGVAKDKAFTFYYPENLEALEAAGAELVYFSPISDTELPDVDALYIGGGFPEVFMHELEKNSSIRLQIKAAIQNNKPVYAECGGLMYLSRSITWKDDGKSTTENKEKNKAEMVGALPCDIFMNKKPKGHGYIRLESVSNILFDEGREIKAHEFHYSELRGGEGFEFAYRVIRGYGVDGKNDGIIYKNVLASYAHLHSLAVPEWAPRFIDFIRAKLGKR